MNDDDQQKITLNIAGRKYPMKVSQSEKQKALQFEKELQTTLMKIQQKYAVKDLQDAMAMLLIQQQFGKEENADITSIENSLSELENTLAESLKKY